MAIPGKNSFLLYHDQTPVIDALTDEQAGKLIKAIYHYSESSVFTPIDDPVANMAFIGIRASLDRATQKYIDICERNKNNGSKGGRPPKNPEEPKKPTGFKKTQTNPENPVKPDSDSDSESESDPDSF